MSLMRKIEYESNDVITLSKKTCENIIQECRKYKYVSFDLFDTLIFRLTDNPVQVFDLVEKRLVKLGYRNGYKEKRLKAERRARKNKVYEDVTLDDIYTFCNYEPIEIAKKVECDTETEVCVPNEQVVSICNGLFDGGKIIVITTDMYLPRVVLEGIIRKCGIRYHQLFISGEEGKTKYQGNLYDEVIRRLNIGKTDIVHIGDNPVSDYKMAALRGVKAILYREPKKDVPFLSSQHSIKYKDNIQHIVYTNALYRKVQYKSIEYEIGYCAVAPFVVEHCVWIHAMKEKNRIDKLWFIAREGWGLYRAYCKMYPEDIDDIRYVAVNKNVLRYPALAVDPSIDSLISALPSYNEFSLSSIFEYFDIGMPDVFCKQIGISPKLRFAKEELYGDKFKKIFDKILDLCKSELNLQKEYFEEYLNANVAGGEYGKQRIGLVNNSLYGNGQVLIENICSHMNFDIEFVGLQFFSFKKCKKSGIEYHTFLKDANAPPLYKAQFIRTTLVLEHLLFENNGTAKRLFKKNGCLYIDYDKQGREEKNNYTVDVVQNAIIDYIHDREAKIDEIYKCPNIMGWRFYFEFLCNPSVDEACIIGSLWDKEGEQERHLFDVDEDKDDDFMFGNLKLNEIIRDFILLRRTRAPNVMWSVGFLRANRASPRSIRFFNFVISVKYIIRDLIGGI